MHWPRKCWHPLWSSQNDPNKRRPNCRGESGALKKHREANRPWGPWSLVLITLGFDVLTTSKFSSLWNGSHPVRNYTLKTQCPFIARSHLDRRMKKLREGKSQRGRLVLALQPRLNGLVPAKSCLQSFLIQTCLMDVKVAELLKSWLLNCLQFYKLSEATKITGCKSSWGPEQDPARSHFRTCHTFTKWNNMDVERGSCKIRLLQTAKKARKEKAHKHETLDIPRLVSFCKQLKFLRNFKPVW